jgi:hypothetical protein
VAVQFDVWVLVATEAIIDEGEQDTEMDVRVPFVTVKVMVPVTPPAPFVTVMVVVPELTPVSTPEFGSIVATLVVELLQVRPELIVPVLPSS